MSAPLRVLSHIPLGLLEPVRAAHPDVELVEIPEEGPLPASARGEIALTQAWGSPNMAEVMTRGVRWVHSYGTGVNDFPFETLGDAAFTCSRGASAVPISEWVMAVLLAAEKELPQRWISEPPKPPERWNIAFLGGLRGRTLAILGFGGIGQAVAQRALAFDMRVRALRRSGGASPVDGVEMVRDIGALVADADHLVLALPLTDATRHLVDAPLLARAKPGLHLVNVSRGGLVDQEGLRAALDDGQVGLASLDCVEPEPLPAGHWLFTHPKVRLSAHISWSGPGALEELIAPFVENLGRYRRGEPLIGRVDRELGY